MLKEYKVTQCNIVLYVGIKFCKSDLLFILENSEDQISENCSKTMGLFKRRDNQIRPSSKSNKSINSSTGSMTRSQLNLAIMEMLNLSQSTHGCDYVCRGKSMSEALTISHSGHLTHFQRI